MKTRSFWIPVSAMALVAGVLLATRAEAARYVGYFLLAEAALFVLAFLLAALLGGAGKVLALGAGLGVGFASVAAILLGEDCDEDDIFAALCISAGDVFALGLVAALILYPAWALGARAGAQTTLRDSGEESPR